MWKVRRKIFCSFAFTPRGPARKIFQKKVKKLQILLALSGKCANIISEEGQEMRT